MAHFRQRKSGSWEITIRRKSLPKPICASADTELEARVWAERVEAELDAGIIRPELLMVATRQKMSLKRWMGEYSETVAVSESDRPLLPRVVVGLGEHRLDALTVHHVIDWVTEMKRKRLTPGSIKKRVGALARSLDIAVHKEYLSVNVARALPRNYSAYAREDGEAVIDTLRERRLEAGEEARLRAALTTDHDWLRLFTLALETAMRLSEMYTLTVEQVDLQKRTIFLDKTKNGDKRQVPMSSVAMTELATLPESGFIFPWFDGDRRRTTLRMSYHWRRFAEAADCAGLHFHDLRHEATCRLFERTTLSDLQISLITGHRDPRMLRRYANLRGSDLAAKLW